MLIEGEKEIYRWKSLTLTNYRVIKQTGMFWKHYWDINYDHLSSVYTGRKPNWRGMLFGIIIWIILGILVYFFIEEISKEAGVTLEWLLYFWIFWGIVIFITGVIGVPKTIIYGSNTKIEENGMLLEFMKKIHECRLKYLGRE